MSHTNTADSAAGATTNRRPRRNALDFVRLGMVLALIMTGLGVAATNEAGAHPAPGGPSQSVIWRVNGHGENYYFGSSWHNCAAYSSRAYSYNLGCSFAEAVANSVSGTAAAGYKAISLSVGYSVTWTKTVTATASFPIARRTAGYIQYHQRYRGTPVHQTGYKCWTPTYNPRYCVATYRRTAYAHKWLGTEFRKV